MCHKFKCRSSSEGAIPQCSDRIRQGLQHGSAPCLRGKPSFERRDPEGFARRPHIRARARAGPAGARRLATLAEGCARAGVVRERRDRAPRGAGGVGRGTFGSKDVGFRASKNTRVWVPIRGVLIGRAPFGWTGEARTPESWVYSNRPRPSPRPSLLHAQKRNDGEDSLLQEAR